tara:strand:+ start:230 stop:1495 length:1266 start_codon:yes stop_codon:yes gene_type:complete
MSLPPSIKEYVPLGYTTPSEAYVYRYTNLNNGMMYIGYHVGIPEDTYLESSEHSDFRALMAGSEPVFKYEILYYGTKSEMQNQEHQLLKEVDARNNPLFYNQSNGTPAFSQKSLNIQKCKDIDERRIKGEFNIGKQPLAKYKDISRYQARAEELNLKAVRKIKGLIEANGGNTDNCDPIFIVNDELINGNHTLEAILQCKKTIDVPVAVLPDEIAQTLTSLEIDFLSKLANKEDTKVKTPNSKKDFVKILVQCKLDDPKFDFNSAKALEILQECNVRTKNEITSIKKMAKSQYVTEKNALQGKIRIEWDRAANQKVIETKVENFRTHDTMSFAASSGHTNKLDTLLISYINLNPNKPHIVVVIYHPSDEAEEAWNRNERSSRYERYMDFFENMIVPELDGIPVERTIRFEELTSYKYDRSI